MQQLGRMQRIRIRLFAGILCLAAAPVAGQSKEDPLKTDRLFPPAAHLPMQMPEGMGAPTPLLEAAPDITSELSLAQLTDLALRNNPRTRLAWATARQEAAQYGLARSATFPRVDLNVTLTRARVVSGTSGAVTPEQNRLFPNFSLNYVLYDFGARAAEVEAQSFRALAASLSQNRVLQEVVFQVEQAYFRLLGVQQLVRTGTQALRNAETTLDATRRRHQAGVATIGDVYRAETAAAQATLNLRRVEGEVAKARGLIAAACGVPIETPLRIQPWSDEVPVDRVKETIDVLVRSATARRPDLAAAQARVKAAQSAVEAAARAGKPTLEFNAQLGRTIFDDGRPRADSNQLALLLRVPIFDGWRDDYAVRRAQAQVAQAEAARDQLFGQTEADVWQAYYDLQTATSGLTTTATLVQGAEQSSAVAAARYQAGVGNLLDLLTAQAEETSAQVQRVQSRLDWYTALARLNFALGASGSFENKP